MGKQCGYLMLPRPAMLHDDDDADDDDESSFFRSGVSLERNVTIRMTMEVDGCLFCFHFHFIDDCKCDFKAEVIWYGTTVWFGLSALSLS